MKRILIMAFAILIFTVSFSCTPEKIASNIQDEQLCCGDDGNLPPPPPPPPPGGGN